MKLKIPKMVLSGRLKTNLIVFFIFFYWSCGQDEKSVSKGADELKKETESVERPTFSSDSAYYFIEKQVSFGPRVPNTPPHAATAKYLSKKLASYDFNVFEQKAQVKAFDGSILNITNIIGEYKAESNNRILLFAHWDTRPFADQDEERKTEPIDGANDGGSGVGVLLEIARQIQIAQPAIGVDIIFFDAEDYGKPSGSIGQQNKNSSWCLGSQYWASNMHKINYRANFGILLDMVGGKDAVFPKEAISMYYAPYIVNKVWNIAQKLGHSAHFVNREVQFVGEDDHLYINQIAKIPSIDIIEYNAESRGFHKSWHTHDDNMDVISKATLQAVGETVLAVVLEEAE